jgi:L-threonylcarbamoyladenylate synthase
MKNYLEAGGLVVYPTSTIPGLGCLPNDEGLDQLFSIKKRPSDMPVSLGVENMNQVSDLVLIPECAIQLLDSFPKGSLTLVLPAINTLDIRLGGDWIAIRVFAHPEAINLASIHGPITATSANQSGALPENDTTLAAEEIGVSHFIPGVCPGGKGSTFVQLKEDPRSERGWSLSVMREGVIPHADVREWWTTPA